eukprot:NODE_23609_length_658_cov_32.451977.p3 GENE.NODE_23609_length_658_cov_32.451977~~NODE_23609_length_658_cov_32.451977.p3  ORF type:complete len:76 (-),score=8.30 NODE_23609_length_658_cov_32.451977:256-483(-)
MVDGQYVLEATTDVKINAMTRFDTLLKQGDWHSAPGEATPSRCNMDRKVYTHYRVRKVKGGGGPWMGTITFHGEF